MFLFRLALALGRTVDELLDSISYPELLKWGKYYQREPFGEWRADVRSAQITQMLANINRDPKKRSDPYQIKDFLLFDKPTKRQTEEPSTTGTETETVVQPELMAWLFAKGKPRETIQ